MKRPWAFICAATTTKSETLHRYCRALYTLGYVPVCPPIQDGQYLVLADPTERADYNDIVREKILRCPLLVLCGQKTDDTTNAQIGLARKYGHIVSSLHGLQAAAERGEPLPC